MRPRPGASSGSAAGTTDASGYDQLQVGASLPPRLATAQRGAMNREGRRHQGGLVGFGHR